MDETLFGHCFSGKAKLTVATGATDFFCIVTIATLTSIGLDRDSLRVGLGETTVMSSRNWFKGNKLNDIHLKSQKQMDFVFVS